MSLFLPTGTWSIETIQRRLGKRLKFLVFEDNANEYHSMAPAPRMTRSVIELLESFFLLFLPFLDVVSVYHRSVDDFYENFSLIDIEERGTKRNYAGCFRQKPHYRRTSGP